MCVGMCVCPVVVRPSRFLDQLLVVLLSLDALQAVRILLIPLDHSLGDAGCQVSRPEPLS